MAFTGLLVNETGLTEGPGTASAQLRLILNTMLQKDGTDWRVNLSQDGKAYIRWNTVTGKIEQYVGSALLPGSGNSVQTGTATLVGGVIAVATATITALSKIYVSRNTVGGTAGHLSVADADNVVGAPGSFEINSSAGADTSTINWLIIN